MFVQKKPDPALAKAELRRNITLFAGAVAVIRAVPYILAFVQEQRS